MSELKELFRLANITLAVTLPILFMGAFLLRNTADAVQQAFGLFIFPLSFAIFFILDERNKRRHGRDQ